MSRKSSKQIPVVEPPKEEKEYPPTYPFVFVHGYSNMTDRMAPCAEIVRSLGYEAYAPHIAPYSSSWDRACDLYAMLVGGTVDYGKVHSKKHHHARYGATYPGLIPNLGQKKADGHIQKVNLVGHSFGGTTIRLLLHLLVEGSAEERDGTKKKENLSPLFQGGHTNWIHSLYAIASPMNGTTLVDEVGTFLRMSEFSKFLDANKNSGTNINDADAYLMDQFGFTSATEHLKTHPFKIARYLIGHDNCYADLSTTGMERLTKDFKTYTNVYYFTQAASITNTKFGGLIEVSDPYNLDRYKVSTNFFNRFHGKGKGLEWRANDGRVNTISAIAPFNEPSQNYQSWQPVRPGIWYSMPVEHKYHNAYLGEGRPQQEMDQFYTDLALRIASLPMTD